MKKSRIFFVLACTFIMSNSLNTTVMADKNIDIESRKVLYEEQEVLNKFLPDSCENLIRLKFSIPNVKDCVEIFIDPEQEPDINFKDEKDLDKFATRYLKMAIKAPERALKTPEKFSYWIEIPEEIIK